MDISITFFKNTLYGSLAEKQCPKCGQKDCFNYYTSISTSNILVYCSKCQFSGDCVELTQSILGCSESEALDMFRPGDVFDPNNVWVLGHYELWAKARAKEIQIQRELAKYLASCSDNLLYTNEGECAVADLFENTLGGVYAQYFKKCVDIGLTTPSIPESLIHLIPKTPSVVYTHKLGKIITHLEFINPKTKTVTHKPLNLLQGAFRHSETIGSDTIFLAKNPTQATALAYKHYVGKSTKLPIVSALDYKLPKHTMYNRCIVNCLDDPTPLEDVLHYLTKNLFPSKVFIANVHTAMPKLTWKQLGKDLRTQLPAVDFAAKALDTLYLAGNNNELYQLGSAVFISLKLRKLLEKTIDRLGLHKEALKPLYSDSVLNTLKATSRYMVKTKNHKMYIVTSREQWLADFTLTVNSTVHCIDSGFTGFEVTIKSNKFPPVSFILDAKDTTSLVKLGEAIKRAYIEQHNISWWEDFHNISKIPWSSIINCLSQNKPIKYLATEWGVAINKQLLLPKIGYKLQNNYTYYTDEYVSNIAPCVSGLYDQFKLHNQDTFELTKLMSSDKPEDIVIGNIICFVFEMMAQFLFTNPAFPGIAVKHMFLVGDTYEQEETFRSALSLFSGTKQVVTMTDKGVELPKLLKKYKALGTLPLGILAKGSIISTSANTLIKSTIPIMCLCDKQTAKQFNQNIDTSFVEMPTIDTLMPEEQISALQKELAGVFCKYAEARIKLPDRMSYAPSILGKYLLEDILGIRGLFNIPNYTTKQIYKKPITQMSDIIQTTSKELLPLKA